MTAGRRSDEQQDDGRSSHTLTESMPAAAGEYDDAPPRSSPAGFARGQLVDALSVRQHTRPRAVHATPVLVLVIPCALRTTLAYISTIPHPGHRYFRRRKSGGRDRVSRIDQCVTDNVQWKPSWSWCTDRQVVN